MSPEPKGTSLQKALWSGRSAFMFFGRQSYDMTAVFFRPKTPRYAGSSKKAKPLNKLKRCSFVR